MDGVVVVVERSGALHFTRSFSARFDRLHAKSDRLNLAALLFAVQNFASNSVLDATAQGDDTSPLITLFETAAERIVMARSRVQGLMIALFVRPSLDTQVARSLVQRIARYYDHDQSTEARLAAALKQHARIFREACQHAIQGEVDACLEQYAASLYTASSPIQLVTGFVFFHYVPLSVNSGQTAEVDRILDDDAYDDDDYDDDFAPPDKSNADEKESQLASPRLVANSQGPPPRLQKLFASTRSLLPQPKVRSGQKGRPKKNAVMDHADPKRFQRFVVFPQPESNSSSRTDDALSNLVGHPQFPPALMDALRPHTTLVSALIGSQASKSMSTAQTLCEGTWCNFHLPQLIVTAGSARITANLRFWMRGGCLLVHIDTPPCELTHGVSVKTQLVTLLDRVEPLARCAVRLLK